METFLKKKKKNVNQKKNIIKKKKKKQRAVETYPRSQTRTLAMQLVR